MRLPFILATTCVAFLVSACGDKERPTGVPSTADANALGDTTSPSPDSAASTDSLASDADAADEASTEDAPPADALADLGPPPDAAIIVRCVGSYAAYPTKGLVAGGKTPKTFADAYNAEVAKLTEPGPLLLAFKGVDSTDASKWKLRVGALALEGAGPDVKFQGSPAEFNFVMSTGISLKVPDQLGSFDLRFGAGSTSTRIPADGVAMTGAAGDCSELSVDELLLMIPESAKNIPFAGSTVGALMGAPIAPDGGPKFWILELLGSEKRVNIAGGVP